MITDNYKTIVFDCDGVILNSNQLKTTAFKKIAMRYGENASKLLVDYHIKNGGISRHRKFEYLLKDILGIIPDKNEIEFLSKEYGDYVGEKLATCELDQSLKELRAQTRELSWMLVSGGSETEIRKTFKTIGIFDLFNSGIFGNPNSKDEILDREIKLKQLILPALFIGDSKYDHQVSEKYGLDFIFVSNWTEFSNWKNYCEEHKIETIKNLESLLK